MRPRAIPGRHALLTLALLTVVLLAAVLAGVTAAAAAWAGLAALAVVVAIGATDYTRSIRAWRQSSPSLIRTLPAGFALGMKREIGIAVEITGAEPFAVELYDHADHTMITRGLPAQIAVPASTRLETSYTVMPTRRGVVTFAPADVRVRSRWRFCELLDRLGPLDERRVYPDFAQVARYAWLAGDRRLQQIGIKTFHRRGQGTDFKQLSEYRIGDSVRHLDWRATLRVRKPIVREFQDERDQCVMLLVDCGRRMRADDRQQTIGTTHFDQVLNAVMLLTYVALKQGDAVGAMTFGTPAGEERSIVPRKGLPTLHALTGALYDVQPTLTHSDYLAAARMFLSRQRKRCLVIVLTNFRDEDSAELGLALRLLRSRHLVMLASIREKVVGELMMQPLTSPQATVDVASAHLYDQARRDAFNRLAARDALMVDAEPDRLAIELVNRYRALKRAGTL
jgi:uncharacterized protein (DUF58 family)